MRLRAASFPAIAALLLCLHVAAAQTPPPGLAALMQAMAQVRSATASFTETQNLQVLSAPLLSSGTLSYRAPDYLRKTTLTPARQDFVLDHDAVSLTGADGVTKKFSLAQAPQIGGLVEAIRGTLSGDLPALEKYYAVAFAGGKSAWQLTLKPQSPALTRFVAWIVIAGTGNRITRIESASGNGDRSDMRISETATDAP